MLPYRGPNEFNILHSWICSVFWLHDICHEMKTGHGLALINRIKNCLVEKRDDVFIADIPEPEEYCQKVISEYMDVVQRYPEFIDYWKATGKNDESLRDYGHSVRKVNEKELVEITGQEDAIIKFQQKLNAIK